VIDLFNALETLQTRQSWSSSDQRQIHGGWGNSVATTW